MDADAGKAATVAGTEAAGAAAEAAASPQGAEAPQVPPGGLREPERIVGEAGSSFGIAMRLMPARRRRAIHAVYAFCRCVDDLVDDGHPEADARAGLDFWSDEVARAYGTGGGAPRSPIGRALERAGRDHGVPRAELDLVIEGMRMDLGGMVAPSEAVLSAYVRRVAGAVGVIAMHVFGAWRGPASERFALALAEGMQLTNILRDVEEDARLGRVYLPAEILAAVGAPADPARLPGAPGLPEARRLLGLRARAAYEAALREVPAHDRLRLAPALMMMGPYERLLACMEADWGRPAARAPGWRKLAQGLARAARPAAPAR